MTTDWLHARVSEALWQAERVEADIGLVAARPHWLQVSEIEEELAARLPADAPEGRIARDGAVHAARKAGDTARADMLAARYEAET